MTPALQTHNLTKDFGAGRGAFDINIDVNPGEIVGFIGPNGAGKTTTIRTIMHLAFPDSGTISLFGSEIHSEADMLSSLGRIGFMPSEHTLYENLNARQIFDYASALYQRDLTQSGLQLAVELDLNTNMRLKRLSTGNKRKVAFIHSILHQPELLILDEPTSGLDPLIQQKLRAKLIEIRKQGGAIFLSSHVLSEVQQICDRIVMIKEGRIILADSTENILHTAPKIFRGIKLTKAQTADLKKLPAIESIETIGEHSTIYASDQEPVIKWLVAHDIYNFYLERATIEEMFIKNYA